MIPTGPSKPLHSCKTLPTDPIKPAGISVLTLCQDRRAHLSNLIEGLCRSTVTPDELLIVDMGGPPIQIPACKFAVNVVGVNEARLPLAKARNLAAAQARNDALMFLDVDCIPMAGLLGAVQTTLQARDAVVCAEVRYLNKGAVQPGWTEADLRRDSRTHPARAFPESGVRAESNPGLFWSLAFAIRGTQFRRLGGFDERFGGYGAEDTDFGFRAKLADVDLLFLGGPGAFHQYHDVFDPPLQHFEDIIRNAQIFYQRWNIWPMRNWLDAFERSDLIRIEPGKIVTIRMPRRAEMTAAKQPDDKEFG
jgi:GT2 family glycosyltransferase